MRVLMIATPSSTHLLPMVPLAWALRTAGHDLLVAVQPNLLDTVERAGLTRHNGYLNVQARTLLACLRYAQGK